jgi:hypothetical protein
MHRLFDHTIRSLSFVLFVLFVTACGPSVRGPEPSTEPATLAEPTSTATTTPTSAPTPTPKPTATSLPEIDLGMELPDGDPEDGYLSAITSGCFGCHTGEAHPMAAPRFVSVEGLPDILDRGESRIALPEYGGRATTNREYMIESILLPEAFIVPGEWEEFMPRYYLQTLTDQDLADILAWISTLE